MVQVTEKLISKFQLKFDSDNPLEELEPIEEIRRNGLEEAAATSISLDPPEGSDLPRQISIIWRDDNEDILDGIDTDKQMTFVMIGGATGEVGETIYRFKGLLGAQEARLWFRDKVGFPPEEEQSASPEPLSSEVLTPPEQETGDQPTA